MSPIFPSVYGSYNGSNDTNIEAFAPISKNGLSAEHQLEMVNSFVTYPVYTLGLASNSRKAWADLKGLESEEAIYWAKICMEAVDNAKTGLMNSSKNNFKFSVSQYPDFMAKRNVDSYPSTKVLGQMFRRYRQKEQEIKQSRLNPPQYVDPHLTIQVTPQQKELLKKGIVNFQLYRNNQSALQLQALQEVEANIEDRELFEMIKYGLELMEEYYAALKNILDVTKEADDEKNFKNFVIVRNADETVEQAKSTGVACREVEKEILQKFETKYCDGAHKIKAARAWYFLCYEFLQEHKRASFVWILTKYICLIKFGLLPDGNNRDIPEMIIKKAF